MSNDVSGADVNIHIIGIHFSFATAQDAANYIASHPELIGTSLTGSIVNIPIPDNASIITPLGEKLELDPQGNFTYSINQNAHDGAMDTLTYTIVDHDGDPSTATVSFDINAAPVAHNDGFGVGNDSFSVFESGLPAGSDHSKPITVTGNILANDDLGTDPKIVKLNFANVDYNAADAVNGVIHINTGNGTLDVYTAATNNHVAGDFVFQLTSATDVPGAGNNILNQLFNYTVTNDTGFSSNAYLLIKEVDDVPKAIIDIYNIQKPDLPSYNLIFTLDISGSMGGIVSGTGKTKLQILKDSLTSSGALLDSYAAASSNLHISIVTFSSNAQAAQTFTDINSAKAFINGLTANGNTNYTDALAKTENAITADANNPALNGYINKDYYISDGEPNVGIPNAAQLATWQSSIGANHYDAVVLNIAPSSNQSTVDQYLQPLANPTDSPAVIHVNADLSNLQTILISTIDQTSHISGNILTNDITGADLPIKVTEIDMTLASNQAAQQYLAAHPELIGASVSQNMVIIPVPNADIVTAHGGLLHIAADGSFVYTANTSTQAGEDALSYKIVDHDGDVSSASLLFEVSAGTNFASASLVSPALLSTTSTATEGHTDLAFITDHSHYSNNILTNDTIGPSGATVVGISFETQDAKQYILDHNLQGLNATADPDGKTVHIPLPEDKTSIDVTTPLGAHLSINHAGDYTYDVSSVKATSAEEFQYDLKDNATQNVQQAVLQMNVVVAPDTMANLHGADTNNVLSTVNHHESIVTMEGGKGTNNYIIDISEVNPPDKIVIMDLGISKQNILTFVGVSDINHDGKSTLSDVMTGYHQDAKTGDVEITLQNHSTLVLPNIGTVPAGDTHALEQHLQNITQEIHVQK